MREKVKERLGRTWMTTLQCREGEVGCRLSEVGVMVKCLRSVCAVHMLFWQSVSKRSRRNT